LACYFFVEDADAGENMQTFLRRDVTPRSVKRRHLGIISTTTAKPRRGKVDALEENTSLLIWKHIDISTRHKTCPGLSTRVPKQAIKNGKRCITVKRKKTETEERGGLARRPAGGNHRRSVPVGNEGRPPVVPC